VIGGNTKEKDVIGDDTKEKQNRRQIVVDSVEVSPLQQRSLRCMQSV
jgi:hypothetical protein